MTVNCPQCGEDKARSEFYAQGKNGIQRRCKVCIRLNVANRAKGVMTPKVEVISLWEGFPNDVIRSIYPTQGAKGCQKMLPSKTIQSIYSQARQLGVARLSTKGEPMTRVKATPIPVPIDPCSHRVWQQIDRTIRGVPVGVLAPRLAA